MDFPKKRGNLGDIVAHFLILFENCFLKSSGLGGDFSKQNVPGKKRCCVRVVTFSKILYGVFVGWWWCWKVTYYYMSARHLRCWQCKTSEAYVLHIRCCVPKGVPYTWYMNIFCFFPVNQISWIIDLILNCHITMIHFKN